MVKRIAGTGIDTEELADEIFAECWERGRGVSWQGVRWKVLAARRKRERVRRLVAEDERIQARESSNEGLQRMREQLNELLNASDITNSNKELLLRRYVLEESVEELAFDRHVSPSEIERRLRETTEALMAIQRERSKE